MADPGLPAANRMTAAQARALNLGDHDQIVGQVLRELGEHGYLAHAEPKALAVDPRGAQGWRTPTRGPRGWPDIVAVREHDGALVVTEVKTGKGRTTPEQARWLAAWSSLVGRVTTYPRYGHPIVWVGILRPSGLPAFYDAVLPTNEEDRP